MAGLAATCLVAVFAAELFLALALAVYLARLVLRQTRLDRLPVDGPILAFAVWTLLSASFSHDPVVSHENAKKLLLFLLLYLAADIQEHPSVYSRALRGKALALIFEKPSLRTRVSFEVGIHQLGLERAQAGEDFAALAKEYSQIPNAAKRGDMGYFPKGKMFPKFDEVAFSAQPGKVTDIFETPNGLNILKVVDKKAPRALAFDEVKPRLMLDMSRLKEQDAVGRKLGELHAAADVKILDPELEPVAAPPGNPPPK